jgi:hypothetical protein
LLQKASDEYSQMESLLASVSGQVEEVVVVAYGFLRSGLPGRAVELLMSRTETRTDPVLSHLLADSLFAIGDYRNAALAYKTWIKTGCGGYLYSMQDTDYWILPVKGDVCSFLPVALRSRLEMLKDATNGEPANLPTHNRPAAKFVLH